MQSIEAAQADMRDAYFNGATGAVTSATVWLVAALVTLLVDPRTGIWTLFFGGMLIFPASLVLCKVVGCSGKHAKDNPLGPLAITGTIWMVLMIILAVALSYYRIEWFFPAMLWIIGGRYLTFGPLYGLKLYYLFGVVLIVAAVPLVVLHSPPVAGGAFAGALIEYAFGLAIFARSKPMPGT